jgi:hypothetical protein
LEEVASTGVKVLAIPELQSLASRPSGSGISLKPLKEKYGEEKGIENGRDGRGKCMTESQPSGEEIIFGKDALEENDKPKIQGSKCKCSGVKKRGH